jgi:hypothetical protein
VNDELIMSWTLSEAESAASARRQRADTAVRQSIQRRWAPHRDRLSTHLPTIRRFVEEYLRLDGPHVGQREDRSVARRSAMQALLRDALPIDWSGPRAVRAAIALTELWTPASQDQVRLAANWAEFRRSSLYQVYDAVRGSEDHPGWRPLSWSVLAPLRRAPWWSDRVASVPPPTVESLRELPTRVAAINDLVMKITAAAAAAQGFVDARWEEFDAAERALSEEAFRIGASSAASHALGPASVEEFTRWRSAAYRRLCVGDEVDDGQWLQQLSTLLQQQLELAQRKKEYLEKLLGTTRPGWLTAKAENLALLKRVAVELARAISAATTAAHGARRIDHRRREGRYTIDVLDRTSQIMRAIYSLSFDRLELTAAIQKGAKM